MNYNFIQDLQNFFATGSNPSAFIKNAHESLTDNETVAYLMQEILNRNSSFVVKRKIVAFLCEACLKNLIPTQKLAWIFFLIYGSQKMNFENESEKDSLSDALLSLANPSGYPIDEVKRILPLLKNL